ncbi:MAG TPA: hypothetical protein VLS85_07090, partial [Hanamia sp.]|nr:hypothetical protein [Hanamia sp.]
MKNHLFFSLAMFLLYFNICHGQSISIQNDPHLHSVTFSNSKLKLVLNYNHQCRISNMEVNGQKVMNESTGLYSEIKTADETFSTLHLTTSPTVTVTRNLVEVNGISYGNNDNIIHESWKFVVTDTGIKFTVTRKCPKSFEAESVSFPAIEFKNINTWEGAFQGFGGIAWFYLFNEKLC